MQGSRGLVAKECKYCGKAFLGAPNRKYCSKKCGGAWRSIFSKTDLKSTMRKDTLCWECRKATAGEDCPWANEFKPVKGWKATPTIVKVTSHTDKRAAQLQDSFIVHKCPLFASDERGGAE